MKKFTIAPWILLAGLILMLPLSGVALEDKGEKASPQRIEEKKGMQEHPGVEAKKSKMATPGRMPVYKPPRRGVPAGRLAGGTRGIGDQLPFLCVLTPEHIGLTIQEQPSLYWFLPELTSYPIEFTIIEFWGIQPLLETPLKPPVQPGVQSIRLKDYGVRLQPGVQYKWFVVLVPDSDHRSKDIITGGEIERITLSDTLRARLKQTNTSEAVHIFAEAGIWYDALSSISELIEAAPNDMVLRKQRVSLLRQVSLPEIARYEIKNTAPGSQ